MSPASPLHLPKNVSRRDILKLSLAGAGITALGPLGRFCAPASAAPQNLKRMIVINMFGGCDTLNMVIPVSLSSYSSRRTSAAGSVAVDTSGVPALGGPFATQLYKLHPSLPRIRALYDEGSVAFVQRVGYPSANLSHFESQDIYSTGVRNGFGPLGVSPSGWIARYANDNAPTSMGAVGLGVGRLLDFIGGGTNPLLVSSLGAFNISGTASNSTNARLHRSQYAKEMIQRYSGAGLNQQSRDALDQAYTLTSAVQTALASYTTAVSWANTSLSQRMRDAAVLIEGGFETRIFYTGYGGFDTHSSQGQSTGSLPSLFTQLDDAVGAFAQDMKNRGVWNDIAIVVITEFGRRNYVNGSAGTDHGHGFCALVIGGAVTGGSYGPDLTNQDLNAEHLAYAVDFRSIYKHILGEHLAADPAPVFPEPLTIETNLQIV